MIVTICVDASNCAHIPNEFSMFSYCSCCMSCSLTSKKLNASLATWCAPRRSCSRNIAVRNVFGALIRDKQLLFLLMFEICYVFHNILRLCHAQIMPCHHWNAALQLAFRRLLRGKDHCNQRGTASVALRSTVVSERIMAWCYPSISLRWTNHDHPRRFASI